ncbi:hypothetical protein QOZ99_002032 [Angulomicrobium amanitiforme]|uniref:Uncharacterized protein n=1 Tax=Ancylobacter amanitiformis TaxID=217069 RepID=A0ABU0LR17_9HYPH|nr:hypothetical protein [Ancylobacter amanitiformis]
MRAAFRYPACPARRLIETPATVARLPQIFGADAPRLSSARMQGEAPWFHDVGHVVGHIVGHVADRDAPSRHATARRHGKTASLKTAGLKTASLKTAGLGVPHARA